MEKYDVSIIVPVYNRAEIIKPCIESINSQTYDKSKWEVIFVDDASTDDSISTIESLIDENINYKIIKRTVGSGNASAPRNEGIKASSSKYVFFLDSDDYVDSHLLENGLAIALRNDSDIVYFKMALGPRINTVRPFKKKVVDKSDVLNDHLMRSLKVFKLYKIEMLNSNNILFDVTIDVFEDMLFTYTALSYSKVISTLADRDYYYATAHDGVHLSRKKISMEKQFTVYFTGLQMLYCSRKEEVEVSKIYNAWLIRCVERFRDISKKASSSNDELINLFKFASNYFNIKKSLFNLSQIYENERLLTLLFLTGDFVEFHKLANESKALKTIQRDLQKEFENESGFSRAWVFKNKVAVLDLVLDDNRIAFDLEINEKEKLLQVWMLSRNEPSTLELIRSKALNIVKHRYLIFNGKISEREEAILEIRKYLGQIRSI